MGIFDKLRQGVFGFYGGANDPRLSPQQNAGSTRDAVINAGLQTILNADKPGLAPLAIGALAGRQAGATSRATTLQQGNQQQMAELFKSGEMDMRMLERAFGQATAAGDFETMRALSPILSASVAAGRAGTPESLQSVEGIMPDGKEVMGVFHPRSGVYTVDGEIVRGFRPRPSRPLVDMGQTQESAMNQSAGSEIGTDIGAMIASGRSAGADLARAEELSRLLATPGVYQGTAGNAILRIKQMATAAGFDLEGVPEAEVARRFIIEEALRMRANPETLLTGATSDQDFNRLLMTTASLGNTPEANQLITDIMKAIAHRRIGIARVARRYAQDNGGFDIGVYDAVENFGNGLSYAELLRRAESMTGQGLSRAGLDELGALGGN